MSGQLGADEQGALRKGWSCMYVVITSRDIPFNSTFFPQSVSPTARLLERAILLRATSPDCCTPAPNVTNLLRRTRLARAILRNDTALRLEQIIHLHERLISQHLLRQVVVKRRVQRRCGRPGLIRVIGCACIVFELPFRGAPGEGLGDVGKVGASIEDRKGFGVDLEGLVAGI